jgi:hypothetical protein
MGKKQAGPFIFIFLNRILICRYAGTKVLQAASHEASGTCLMSSTECFNLPWNKCWRLKCMTWLRAPRKCNRSCATTSRRNWRNSRYHAATWKQQHTTHTLSPRAPAYYYRSRKSLRDTRAVALETREWHPFYRDRSRRAHGCLPWTFYPPRESKWKLLGDSLRSMSMTFRGSIIKISRVCACALHVCVCVCMLVYICKLMRYV